MKLNPDAFEEAAHQLEDDAAILKWIEQNGVTHSAEEIEQWNQAMVSRHPDSAVKEARFFHFLKEAGGEGRKDIRTYFDLIEFDEGREVVEALVSSAGFKGLRASAFDASAATRTAETIR